ncbi:hypothetical protein [Azospirillum rugosum]|uniref:Uncharacterized protein n=1 Tax=Azospirillum rugosum TaxID=416170 RepID=A0ABS4SDU0_9PROT|nr:hypothetical protein [Azospirillum rugosum]MBP2290747.1 hypothetical protein [Azospirillum rugosum]MDQ0525636.1 hypothetical protein [Azospirillum rugosum]
MSSRIVLALDVGTSLGWAVQRASGRIESGRHTLPTGKRQGERLHAFRLWLADILTRLGHIDTIIWEHAFRQPGNANEVHHNLVGVLLDFAERNRITDYHSVDVKALKGYAAGNGNADKDAMVAAARAAGYPVRSHDEADAVHLLRYEISGRRAADLPRLAEARQKRREQKRRRAANQNKKATAA